MATLKVEFGAKKKNGNRKIYVILSQHGKRKRLDTKIEVAPHEITKTKSGTVKIAGSKQNILDKKMSRYRETIYTVERDYAGQTITLELLVDHILGKRCSDGTPEFFAFADEYLATHTMKGKKNYTTMLNSLERHLGRRSLPFSQITYAMLDGYLQYLKDKPRARSLYLGAIRHLHNEARRRFNTDEVTLISPTVFERFRVPKQQPKGQRALTADDIRRIIAYSGKGRAALARDCFVLSFLLMGMNSADMYDSDAKIIDGKICYRRMKVRGRRSDGAYIEVDIPPEAQPLMDRYKDTQRVFNFHRRYYSESGLNKAINIGLRQVSSDLKIDKLQFYQARHTWASIARNECAIDAYTVDKALNHIQKDMRLLDVYVKRDFRLINEANRKVIDYIKNEEQDEKEEEQGS